MTNDILNYQNKLPSRALISGFIGLPRSSLPFLPFLRVSGARHTLPEFLLLLRLPQSPPRVLLLPSFWVHITLSSLLPRQDDPHLELHCHLDLGRLICLQPSSLVNKKLFTKSFFPWQPTEQPPLDVPRPRKQNLSNGACHLPAFPTPPYFCYHLIIIICPHSSPRCLSFYPIT